MTNRRDFLKKVSASTAGIAVGGAALGMSAKSYNKIIGANDKLNVAIMGLGRRLGAYTQPLSLKESNVELKYLCDVMEHQRVRAGERFAKILDYKPKLENDFRKILEDQEIDAIINATPDHWHTPGSIMAMQAGKHVYVEKPCSHNMNENEMLVAASKKYNKVVQMGNQQRSSPHTGAIINEIHNGVIGVPYRAVAFYVNTRGEVPVQQKAAVPTGLDWEIWQGPAIHRDYTSETWDYNWHWYGWNYGTGELGNNATHELDVARWALQVEFPGSVYVDAGKRHFFDDGWEMYDSMYATFKFDNDKVINWDGRSRSGQDTYGFGGRGTLIYGSEGTVFVDRGKFVLFDRAGKVVREQVGSGSEAGTALGGGGDASTGHVMNWFNGIRGKEELRAPIADASVSQAMVHYANVAYRVGHGFDIDSKNGSMFDREAMKLWGREYDPNWTPKL
ncbi:Gfo/Idh/MocA family protein [Maribellus sediminis]|uniref:Gfo/Idh/MocA family protein n=1 Tax=Maribellus sediminis TaxID=2696285 RepID=UPI00143045B0|nr:Gfo/Idh/MocA family oxidoreductase [Maribellus sediminis]